MTLIVCRDDDERRRVEELLDDSRLLDEFDTVVVAGVTDDMVDAARKLEAAFKTGRPRLSTPWKLL